VEAWGRHGGEREWDILEVLVDPKRPAFDVGANSGVYTSRLAALVPEVLAIEPNPDLCNVLRRAGYRNVRVVEAAISDRSGRAKLFIPIREDGNRSLPCATLEPTDQLRRSDELEVRVTTLDEFADSSPGFVKIDIEGHEIAALRGAQGLVSAHRPNVVVEVEDDERTQRIAPVRDFFASIGYQGFFLREGGIFPIESLTPAMQDRALLDKNIARRDSPFVNNFIFLPAEKSRETFDRIAARLARA
jgi:FkbM family methyltransferase